MEYFKGCSHRVSLDMYKLSTKTQSYDFSCLQGILREQFGIHPGRTAKGLGSIEPDSTTTMYFIVVVWFDF